jgi:enterochelin esterase-like enzyme
MPPSTVRSASPAPTVDVRGVTFRLPDPNQALTAVHLAQEVIRPRVGPPFSRVNGSGQWRLRFPRPPADRLEYRFALTHRHGAVEIICDPANPLRAPGPFGEKSVVEFPGYRPPAWLQASIDPGAVRELSISSTVLRRRLPLVLWTAPDRSEGEPLPLLVVHDGPEYDRFSELTRFLAWGVSTDRIPSLRAALLAPIDRDEIYSASAAYARALAQEIIPALSQLAPTPLGRVMRAGMGASLGALAMLHAHRTNAAAFGGLFLQSGSFFRQRFDSQEAGFGRFRRITRFVGKVVSEVAWVQPIRLAMTCGRAEENLRNNRFIRDALAAQGYDISWHEHPDAHNWTSWRDTLDPHLTRFLRELWV